jgi:thiamine-phosphate diphosphorylase
VGVSTHTRAQVDAALGEAAGYLGVGPVFRTATKETAYDPVGLDLIRYAAAAARRSARPPVPVVAIGGVTLERAAEVIDAGASALAVISDLLTTGDPEARVRAYVERLGPP